MKWLKFFKKLTVWRAHSARRLCRRRPQYLITARARYHIPRGRDARIRSSEAASIAREHSVSRTAHRGPWPSGREERFRRRRDPRRPPSRLLARPSSVRPFRPFSFGLCRSPFSFFARLFLFIRRQSPEAGSCRWRRSPLLDPPRPGAASARQICVVSLRHAAQCRPGRRPRKGASARRPNFYGRGLIFRRVYILLPLPPKAASCAKRRNHGPRRRRSAPGP